VNDRLVELSTTSTSASSTSTSTSTTTSSSRRGFSTVSGWVRFFAMILGVMIAVTNDMCGFQCSNDFLGQSFLDMSD